MCKGIVKGALIGGAVLYLWMLLSWMILPWHKATMHEFKNEEFVTWVLKENTGKGGIYVAPSTEPTTSSTNSEQLASESLVFVSISDKANQYKTPWPYISSLLTNFIGAAFLSFMLLKCVETAYFKRVRFVMMFAFALAIMGNMPMWTWRGFSTGFTVVEMLDQICGWFLAALFLAKLVPPADSNITVAIQEDHPESMN